MRTRKQGCKPLAKCPTGIHGLDDITEGGLPRGRPTLVCEPAGCGKTLLAMEFIVRGITQFGEPGIFMAFEEKANELATNMITLGMDVEGLIQQKKLAVDYVHIERSEIEETGDYDLEGLFVRLGNMIDQIGAKRVDLQIIDIYQQPSLAAGEQIIAAPTLIKKLPLPLRKFIGNLTDREKIMVGLDLQSKKVS